MNKRILAGLLAVLMLLPAAGCGKKTDSTDSQAAPPAGETSAADISDGETNAAEEAASAEPVTDENGETVETAAETITTNENDEVGEGQTAPVGGADNDQEGEYGTAPAETAAEAAAAAETTAKSNSTAAQNNDDSAAATASPASKGGNEQGKLQITVETVEITLDELKAQDYTVTVAVTLDKNPGISYSEWGLKLDSRCTYTEVTRGLDFSTYPWINEEKHFLWAAWASGAKNADYDGTLLKLDVKVPMDTQPGTTYLLEYADMSLAPAAHIWQNSQDDWVKSDEVGWTNGGIVVK